MARLTSKDYREVLNLIYLAHRCEDVESFINALFPPIMKAFNIDSATFQLLKGHPQNVTIGQSRSFKLDNHKLWEDKYYPILYKNSFYQHSPLLKEASSSSKPFLKFGESISFQDWGKSEFYNDFMRPQHLYWELFLTLRWKNNLEGMITLWRPKEQPDYEDKDVLKAEMLASHLGVAIHNICLISQINTHEGHPQSTDEANGEGILWLDHRFMPSFFNAKARDICMQLSDSLFHNTANLEEGEFPIPAYVIKDCSDLLDLLKAEELLSLAPKERTIFTKNGKKFRIECSLKWKTDKVTSTPNFMITLSDLTDEEKLETALQARFHLSGRELDVIHYLIRGLSDDEIGEKLYISRQTVHTHIKNIYRKLGAKSRVELSRRVIQEYSITNLADATYPQNCSL